MRKKHNSGDSDDTQCDNVEEAEVCDDDSNSTGSLDRREGDDPDFRPTAGDEWVHSRGGKRKYQRHLPPPSEIKTRGAKLPKYSFERKTHQKVLLNLTQDPVAIAKISQAQISIQGKRSFDYLYVQAMSFCC